MIFIDTGAFVARFVERDQYHQVASAFWNDLAKSNEIVCTSNLVLSEALTLLARRTNYMFAADRARSLYASDVVQILRPTMVDETSAIIWLERFADQKVSFCDCVSSSLMRRLSIPDVFTFDLHFELAGFNSLPQIKLA